MNKNVTYSDPEGSFTWINPISVQRKYPIPPADHEEAIRLFEGYPDFEKLHEVSELEGGTANVQDAVRSGLKRSTTPRESLAANARQKETGAVRPRRELQKFPKRRP